MNDILTNEVLNLRNALAALEEKTGMHVTYEHFPKPQGDFYGDGKITFKFRKGKREHVFAVELMANPLHNGNYSAIEDFFLFREEPDSRMLIAPAISGKIKRRCREINIGYLDFGGNLYFSQGEALVFIDGQKMPKPPAQKETNRAFSKSGLKVIFSLLANPNNIDLSYRKLADAAGVSLGTIGDVIKGLVETGYVLDVNAGHRILTKKKELLNEWISGYFLTLKPSLFIGRFRFISDLSPMANQEGPVTWTGEAGAGFFDLEVFADSIEGYTNLDLQGLLKIGISASQNNGGPVWLYERFWKAEYIPDPRLASVIVIYADLTIKDDPRSEAAAQRLYDLYLKDHFEHE